MGYRPKENGFAVAIALVVFSLVAGGLYLLKEATDARAVVQAVKELQAAYPDAAVGAIPRTGFVKIDRVCSTCVVKNARFRVGEEDGSRIVVVTLGVEGIGVKRLPKIGVALLNERLDRVGYFPVFRALVWPEPNKEYRDVTDQVTIPPDATPAYFVLTDEASTE